MLNNYSIQNLGHFDLALPEKPRAKLLSPTYTVDGLIVWSGPKFFLMLLFYLWCIYYHTETTIKQTDFEWSRDCWETVFHRQTMLKTLWQAIPKWGPAKVRCQLGLVLWCCMSLRQLRYSCSLVFYGILEWFPVWFPTSTFPMASLAVRWWKNANSLQQIT